ncbi:ArsR/SmtB family transcription factor [Hyphomicrobium sp.]|uniref:ArsR/SmtB family transcription factor n=1 Tax=Hyphomicrobium sp. TaxID=82 RepID=UPI0039C85D4B
MGVQRPFLHPPAETIRLESILYALADPVRLEIVRRLISGDCPLNCSTAAPSHLPKSTQSHHFQVLREAGLIQSERRGTEVVNSLRIHEIDEKFPGVVAAILKAAKPLKCPDTERAN